MKIQVVCTIDGDDRQVEWPAGWPVPRVGDAVTLPDYPQALVVTQIDWAPEGDRPDGEPMVWVVVGQPG